MPMPPSPGNATSWRPRSTSRPAVRATVRLQLHSTGWTSTSTPELTIEQVTTLAHRF
jgi:hypothetical protein